MSEPLKSFTKYALAASFASLALASSSTTIQPPETVDYSGKMTTINHDGSIFAIDPLPGLDQSELDNLIKWYGTIYAPLIHAQHYHVSQPDPNKLFSGRTPRELLAKLDPEKDYSMNDIYSFLGQESQEMLQSLDNYSVYLPPALETQNRHAINGTAQGHGFLFATGEDGIKVTRLAANSAADKAQIQIDDLITQIGDTPTGGKTPQEILQILNTDEALNFTIERNGQMLDQSIAVKREIFEKPSVYGSLLNGEVAYIRISTFDNNTHLEFKNMYEALEKQSNGALKGIIMDLRDNLGGVLAAANEIIDMVSDKDQFYHYHEKGPLGMSEYILEGETYRNEITDLPISVLINHASASSAEVLAGALKDIGRAKIIGDGPSFGKGTAQKNFQHTLPTGQKAGFKITTGYYSFKNLGAFQGVGISPDILLPPEDTTLPHIKMSLGNVKYEREIPNSLNNPNQDQITIPAHSSCALNGEAIVVDIFNWQTQKHIRDAEINNHGIACAVEYLTGESQYTTTTKLKNSTYKLGS